MFRILGLLVGLIAFRLLEPDVYFAGQHALISIFQLIGDIPNHLPTDVSMDAAKMTAGYMVQPR